MNLQLVCDGTAGLCAGFALQAQDNSGNPWPASGTATIDLYTSAFLVNVTGDVFQIVPKIILAPGAPTETVTATFNLTDTASGVSLPPITVSVDLVAPPNPLQKATQVVITIPPGRGTGTSVTDPGNATIPVSLS